ncbi:MAG: hypothetical protein A3G87_01480 [Omnitrophica bacterium RIFCSPLOWO2_12_FULL_50_11]|nr:MAG: hypothetical protein A3G87_01480 [Omnitrophica bacterium RIFCSPLOWO2_12_FULL_50_11]
MRHYFLNLIVLAHFIFLSPLFAETQVSGRVTFEGTPPAPETIKIKSEIGTCGNAKEINPLILGGGGGVADAVVTIVGIQGMSAPGPKVGRLDQEKCEYKPHVQILPVGSMLKVRNSDPIYHNTHGFNEDGSTAFNIEVPTVGIEVPTKIRQPGVIKVRCDAGHTWMTAYVVGVDQPHYALTDRNGNFEIAGVAPGNYEIEVWHEWLGKYREPITAREGSEPITITLKKSS